MTAFLTIAWWLAPLAGALAVSALLEAPRWFGSSDRWRKFRPTVHVITWTIVLVHYLADGVDLETPETLARIVPALVIALAAGPLLRDAVLGIVVRANHEIDVGVTIASSEFSGRVTRFDVTALWVGTTRVPYRRLVDGVTTVTAAASRGHVHEFEVTAPASVDVERERRALVVVASLSPLADPHVGVEVWYLGASPDAPHRFRIRGVVATAEDGERWASDVRVRLRTRGSAT